jgi:hypothetical protein
MLCRTVRTLLAAVFVNDGAWMKPGYGEGLTFVKDLGVCTAPIEAGSGEHAGCAFVWGPGGELLTSTQRERIREEMIVATLDSALLARERSLAN